MHPHRAARNVARAVRCPLLPSLPLLEIGFFTVMILVALVGT